MHSGFQNNPMTKPHVLGFLIGSLWIATALADPETPFAVKQAACAIELSRLKSPDAYLVAVIERTGKPKCDDSPCIERVAVIEVLAAGERSAHLTSISIHLDRVFPPEGSRSVGVYVPSPDGKSYLPFLGTIPVIPTVIADYRQAVELALSNRTGAPDCNHTP